MRLARLMCLEFIGQVHVCLSFRLCSSLILFLYYLSGTLLVSGVITDKSKFHNLLSPSTFVISSDLVPTCFLISLLSSVSTSAAKAMPVIAEPEIDSSQSLDDVTGFLLLMSEGLISALESAHGPEQANQVSRLMMAV